MFQPFSLPGRFQQGVKQAFVHSSVFATLNSVTHKTSYQEWITHYWKALCGLSRVYLPCFSFYIPTLTASLPFPKPIKTIRAVDILNTRGSPHNVRYNYLKRVQPELARLDGKRLKLLQICCLFSPCASEKHSCKPNEGLCSNLTFFSHSLK